MKSEDLITIFRLGLPHHKIVEIVSSLQVRIEGKIYTIKKSRDSRDDKIKYTNIEDYIKSADIFKGDEIDSGRVSLDWLYNEHVYVNADMLSDSALMMYRKYRSQFTDEEPVHLVEVVIESYDWTERSFYTIRDYDKINKFQSDEFLDKKRGSRHHANVFVNVTPFASREELTKVLPMHKLTKLYPSVKKFEKKFIRKSWTHFTDDLEK